MEEEGLRQFLIEIGNSNIIEGNSEKLYQWYLSSRKDRQLFRKIVRNTFEKMEILFLGNDSDSEKFDKKKKLFNELRKNYKIHKREFEVLSYDKWFERELNNSHLLGVQRYNSQVDKFRLLFEEHGQQWSKFFDAVRKVKKSRS